MKTNPSSRYTVQVFSIPKDSSLTVQRDLYFVLLFDQDGTIDHDDHPGHHAKPKLPFKKKVGPSTPPKLHQAKATGTVTLDFTPAKKSGAKSRLTMHTITIGDRKR